MVSCFQGGHVFRDGKFCEETLWVSDGKISPPQNSADAVIDCKGLYVVPGFIDIQVNGGFGHDFTSDPSTIGLVGDKLLAHGVTSFLATFVSTSLPFYERLSNPPCLGYHLEGPCFHPQKMGAHNPQHDFDVERFVEVIQNCPSIKMLTFAPEMASGKALLQHFGHSTIVCSAGHSMANYEEGEEAFKEGIRCITHLFNAMPPLAHREPGIVGAALNDPNVFSSIIADGIHVHPTVVKLAWKLLGKERLILISDMTAATGMQQGIYYLGPAKIEAHNKKCTIPGTQTIAGSALPLDELLRRFMSYTNATLEEALVTVTSNPAKLLNLCNKGHLGIGADADIVLVDKEYRIVEARIR